MAQDEIHKSDIGTIFRRTIQDGDTPVDVSAASTKSLIFRKPTGTIVTQPAAFTTDGTDGQIQYTVIASDLDTVGMWRLQAHVVLAAGEWRSDITEFYVNDNLS